MKVLHLSDTPLSGGPLNISRILNKYTDIESRHIVWRDKVVYRDYGYDLLGSSMSISEITSWLDWADIIHYHNRWQRQEIFAYIRNLPPPRKPSVIQIHSPRESEDFSEELASGIPIAVIAQYHVREWNEAKFIVPNMVDIWDGSLMREAPPIYFVPRVSYAPSNTNMRGWNDKGYGAIAPVLKRMKLSGEIFYDLIIQKPFSEVLPLKKLANIGVEDLSGSYHLSSLEYLSLGCAVLGCIDDLTKNAIKEVCGATEIPWVQIKKDTFERILRSTIRNKNYVELGVKSRQWMNTYWDPKNLCQIYKKMYESL